MILQREKMLKFVVSMALLFTFLFSSTFTYADVTQEDLNNYGNNHAYQTNGWNSNHISGLFRVGNQYYIEIMNNGIPTAVFLDPNHLFSHNYAINRSTTSGHSNSDIHSVFLDLSDNEFLDVIRTGLTQIMNGRNMGASINTSIPDRITFSVPSNLLGRNLQAYNLHQNRTDYSNRVIQMSNFDLVIVLGTDYNSGGLRLVSAYPSSRVMPPPAIPPFVPGLAYTAPLVSEVERLLNIVYAPGSAGAYVGGAWMVAQHLFSWWLNSHSMCGSGGSDLSGKRKRDVSSKSCTLPAKILPSGKQLPVSYSLPYHLVQEDGSAVGIKSHIFTSDELGMMESEKEATKVIIESAHSTEPIVKSGDSVYIRIETENGQSFYLMPDGRISRDSDAIFSLEYENGDVKLTHKISGKIISFNNTQPLSLQAVVLKKPEDEYKYPHDEL